MAAITMENFPIDHLKIDMNKTFDNIFGDVLRETNEVGEGPQYNFDDNTGEISYK